MIWHNSRSGLRSVLAVFAGIVTMHVVSFPIAILLGVLMIASHSDDVVPGSDVGWGWKLGQLFSIALPALLGGYIAAWLAPIHRLAHAVATAIVISLLNVFFLIFATPASERDLVQTIMLVIVPAAVIFGGYLRTLFKAAGPSPGHEIKDERLRTEHSKLGIASCILIVPTILFPSLAGVVYVAVDDVPRPDFREGLLLGMLIILLFGLAILTCFIGLVLGIIGCNSRDKIRTMAWVGTSVHGLILFGPIIVLAGANIYFSLTRAGP